MKLQYLVFALVAFFILQTASAQAVRSCSENLSISPESRPRQLKSAASLIADLQSLNPSPFINQMNYEHMIMPGGGGACATASAVNWVQVLRKYLGLPVINPDTIIRDAFRTLPVLLDGRVTNSQMEELLIYLQKYALGSVADLRIDNTADHGIQENGNVWRNAQSIGVKGLIPSSGTMKILIYVVQNSSKRILGRHFVLVKGLKITKNTDNTVVTIDVLDSKNTSKNYSYQVQHVYGRDMKSYSLTLVRPNSPADSAILTIDTVVTTFLNPQD